MKSTKITTLEPGIDKEAINNENIEISIEERLISANISDGKQFAKKCVACHSFEIDAPNKIGPNLYNIHERQIASISTFKYSKALKSITDKWNNNNLDLFLKNPKKWAPGTKMSYTGIKKGEDRANLIKYLQILWRVNFQFENVTCQKPKR